jgi:RNA-binding protein
MCAKKSGLGGGPRLPELRRIMYDLTLSGAQKSFLRGLGQTLEPALKLGRGGATPAFFAELQALLRAHELVKLRFLNAERAERAAWCAQIADEGRCLCVGAVGHTALFYRQQPEPSRRRIVLPE